MTAGHGDIQFVSYLMENYSIQVGQRLGRSAGHVVRVDHMGQGARTARILPKLYGLQLWLGDSTSFLWFP